MRDLRATPTSSSSGRESLGKYLHVGCYHPAMPEPLPGAADDAKRVAMLVALPLTLWNRIRDDARDVGVGPSELIEPILLQAFGCDGRARDGS